MTSPSPAPKRCPHPPHRCVEDGVRIDKRVNREGGRMRECFILSTCHDCGTRLETRWRLDHPRGPFVVDQSGETT